jgi:hypothetical protein
VFSSITRGVSVYLRKNGFKGVNEIVGLSHHR